MAAWSRNAAPGGKGINIHADYVRTEVIRACPPVVEYLPSYATQHWLDSHGSLDELETSAAGTVVEWMTAIRCSGASLIVEYTTFWLVTGTPPGSTAAPSSLFRWDRKSTDGKGVATLDVILLPFYPPDEEDAEGCEIFEDDCYEPGGERGKRKSRGLPGTPVCDPTLRCGLAKAGRLFYDSHGSLDKIESWPIPGLQTTMITAASIVSEDCLDHIECPAGEYPFGNYWRLHYDSRIVILHPGSVPLGTRVVVLDCCQCCFCACPTEPCASDFVPDCCVEDGVEYCIPKTLDFSMPLKSNNCDPCGVIVATLTWTGGCEWEGTCTPPACYNGGTPFQITFKKVGAAWVIIGPWGTSSPGTVQCCPFSALFAGLDDNGLNQCCVSPCTPAVVNDATVQ